MLGILASAGGLQRGRSRPNRYTRRCLEGATCGFPSFSRSRRSRLPAATPIRRSIPRRSRPPRSSPAITRTPILTIPSATRRTTPVAAAAVKARRAARQRPTAPSSLNWRHAMRIPIFWHSCGARARRLQRQSGDQSLRTGEPLRERSQLQSLQSLELRAEQRRDRPLKAGPSRWTSPSTLPPSPLISRRHRAWGRSTSPAPIIPIGSTMRAPSSTARIPNLPGMVGGLARSLAELGLRLGTA